VSKPSFSWIKILKGLFEANSVLSATVAELFNRTKQH